MNDAQAHAAIRADLERDRRRYQEKMDRLPCDEDGCVIDEGLWHHYLVTLGQIEADLKRYAPSKAEQVAFLFTSLERSPLDETTIHVETRALAERLGGLAQRCQDTGHVTGYRFEDGSAVHARRWEVSSNSNLLRDVFAAVHDGVSVSDGMLRAAIVWAASEFERWRGIYPMGTHRMTEIAANDYCHMATVVAKRLVK